MDAKNIPQHDCVFKQFLLYNYQFSLLDSHVNQPSKSCSMITDATVLLVQCLQQKHDAEKKLSSLTSQEFPSTDANILVKHLQDELRSCVCFILNNSSFAYVSEYLGLDCAHVFSWWFMCVFSFCFSFCVWLCCK